MTNNAPGTISGFWAVLIALIFAALGFGILFFGVIAARAEEDEFCAAVAVLFAEWDVVRWEGSADLPTDLEMISFVYLTDPTLPDENIQALQIEWSDARQEHYMFAYRSMRVSTGEGQEGDHDLCPVRVHQID